MLEAAEIDANEFLGLVAGCEVPGRSLVENLATGENPTWTRRGRDPGDGKDAPAAARRGFRHGGFRRGGKSEALREQEPDAARELAWQLLEQTAVTGGAGADCRRADRLAGGSPRNKTARAFQAGLRDPRRRPARRPPPGQDARQPGPPPGHRRLPAAGATRILKYRAFPDVELHGGDEDDRAAHLLLGMFHAGPAASELDSASPASSRRWPADDALPLRGAYSSWPPPSLDQGRDPERAAWLYDDLLATPYFMAAPPACRALAGAATSPAPVPAPATWPRPTCPSSKGSGRRTRTSSPAPTTSPLALYRRLLATLDLDEPGRPVAGLRVLDHDRSRRRRRWPANGVHRSRSSGGAARPPSRGGGGDENSPSPAVRRRLRPPAASSPRSGVARYRENAFLHRQGGISRKITRPPAVPPGPSEKNPVLPQSQAAVLRAKS